MTRFKEETEHQLSVNKMMDSKSSEFDCLASPPPPKKKEKLVSEPYSFSYHDNHFPNLQNFRDSDNCTRNSGTIAKEPLTTAQNKPKS